MNPKEFHYRIDALARGAMPGRHRGQGGDSGMEFRGHAWLLDAPDPRRLDLHASLRDPLAHDSGQWRVKLFRQRKAIAVQLVADLSASMGFAGRQRRIDVLADLAEALAWSAWRSGDRFGFIGCSADVLAQPRQAPTRSRGAGGLLAQQLRAHAPGGSGAAGLLRAHQHLGPGRSLVFLASDFHLPDDRIHATLASLAAHDVVPVVLWDEREFDPAGGPGLLPLQDAESGQRRLLWWRPALRERWLAARDARRDALARLFRTHRRRPLFIDGGFDADAVTRHFQS